MKIIEVTGGYLARMVNRRTVYLHVEVGEKALGKALPQGAEMHHVDGDPKNNTPTNLVICPNHEYHMLLHQRQRALSACGHADWRPCHLCGVYDEVTNMRPHYKQFYHRACMAQKSRAQRARIKEQSKCQSNP